MIFKLNDILTTKKPHVCGSYDWKVVRTGADIKLECCGCQRVIMMPKYELDKKVKKINNEALKQAFFMS